MSARALMILGTASHVGKSILTAALGRILADEGYRVAPFKAQNMSLNSAATPDGREIGRAQALQAEACRVSPRAEMNPILLKPSTDTSSQVVVLGRVWGQLSASEYHTSCVEELFPIVLESYRALARDYEVILLEGAGSPAEINLMEHDIVNMRMAHAAGAACLLVGDIERGGVFASLAGTVELLGPADRALIRGFIINKFRGDETLLTPGIHTIARRIHVPCVGVVPYLVDLGLDEEDSVALEYRRTARRVWSGDPAGPDRPLRVGVVALPHMANFTDFDALAAEPSVALAYFDRPEDVAAADLLILPGSKQTLDDLEWLRRSGFASRIEEFSAQAPIVGICGGMQMLGRSIADPAGAESDGIARREFGLGLLPVATVLNRDKVTRLVRGRLRRSTLFGQAIKELEFHGYEIHLGETAVEGDAEPFANIVRAGEDSTRPDGIVNASGLIFGTYVHGLFQEDGFRHAFIAAARAACGLARPVQFAHVAAGRERSIDRLADHVRQALDMDLIRSWVEAAKTVMR